MIGGIIVGALGVIIFFSIVYFGVKAANNSNIPKASDQRPISKLSRRELKRL